MKELWQLFNYIKFAIFQILGFLLSIPELVNLKINEKKYNSMEKFRFIKSHAKRSLDLVKIKINVIGKEKVPKEEVLFVLNHSSMLDSYIKYRKACWSDNCRCANLETYTHSKSLAKYDEMCIYRQRK